MTSPLEIAATNYGPDAIDELHELREEARFLECLRAGGVDNWEWYGDACELFNKGEEA